MSFVTAAQQQIADDLAAREFFADNGIEVLSQYLKDIDSQIDIAIAKIGACVVIMSPELDSSFQNSKGPFFDKISFIAAVFQSPTVVETMGIQCIDIAVEVAFALYLLQVDILNGPLVLHSPGIKMIPEESGALVVHYVYFTAQGGDRDEPSQVAPVIISGTSTITLTCATPGAAIFYRTDGKLPATAGTSTLYTGPFSVSSGTKVAARAWLAGFVASPVAQLQT